MHSDKAKLSMEIDGQYHEIPGVIGPIKWRNDTDVRVNVYCMHAVVVPHHGSEVVDSDNFKFGNTYALVMNIDEFLRRVRQAAERAGHEVSWKLIRYIDPASYHGPAGVFTKDVKFSYQSEFRIVMRPGTGEAVSLILGNLSDIMVTGDLTSINEKFRFCPSGG